MAKKSKFFEPLTTLIAGGTSVKAASDAIGCSPSTGYRLSSETEFQNEVERLRAEFVRQSVGKLKGATNRAVETLIDLLDTDDDSIRLRAAVAILDRFTTLSENLELRERIEAIEKIRVAA